jgi:hypothetical protein
LKVYEFLQLTWSPKLSVMVAKRPLAVGCAICAEDRDVFLACGECGKEACAECYGTYFEDGPRATCCMFLPCTAPFQPHAVEDALGRRRARALAHSIRRRAIIDTEKELNFDTMQHIVPLVQQAEQAMRDYAEHRARALAIKPGQQIEERIRHVTQMHSRRDTADFLLKRALTESMSVLRSGGGARVRMMRCAHHPCKGGFRLSDGICLVCKKLTCTECLFKVEGSHVCKPDDVEAVKLILEDNKTRSCPNCFVTIHRPLGCNAMFCVACCTFFDWGSGKVLNKAVHNPEFSALPPARRAEIERALAAQGAPSSGALLQCVEVDSAEFMRTLDCLGSSPLVAAHRQAMYDKRVVLATALEATEDVEQKRRRVRVQHMMGRTLLGLKRIADTPETMSMQNYTVVESKPYSQQAHDAALGKFVEERACELEVIEALSRYVATAEDLMRASLTCPVETLGTFVKAFHELRAAVTEDTDAAKLTKWGWKAYEL